MIKPLRLGGNIMLNFDDYGSTATSQKKWPDEFEGSSPCPVYVLPSISTESPDEKTGISDHVDQLKYLQDNLGFNISQISAILNATRPSVYNWLGGSTPNPNTTKRLDSLYDLLAKWDSSKFGKIGHLSTRKQFNGITLFSLLCEDELNLEDIRKTLSLLEDSVKKMQLRKQKSKAIYDSKNYQPLSKSESKKAVDKITKKIG